MPSTIQMIEWLLIGTPILIVLVALGMAMAGGLMSPVLSSEITKERRDD